MLVAELIRRKRDGGELSAEEIEEIVAGITDGGVTDAQVGALAMAIVWRGMSGPERVALTGAMMRSGEVLSWHGAAAGGSSSPTGSASAPLAIDRPILDKHSTGGVGDKVSLLLAPIVAACGGAVPMISGRGLGHTGGTLDKLESIPGYDVTPTPERFREVVATVGCAVIGQTAQLAPADRRLYGIRDATGTVESLPLIVASILSKKLAAGLDALVMDVKAGSGAFLPNLDDTRELARAIVEVARGNGLPTSALITDMDQVLGRTAGNGVEVRESIDVLTGSGVPDPRLLEVTVALSAELLVLGGLQSDPGAARAAVERSLSSGAAAEKFAEMVTALGGPSDLLDAPDDHLPRAPIARPVQPSAPGVVTGVDVRAVGVAIVALGGGRARETDAVDHAVGLTEVAALGETVGSGSGSGSGSGGRPLAILHARDEASFDRAAAALRAAFTLGDVGDRATLRAAPPAGGAKPEVLEVIR